MKRFKTILSALFLLIVQIVTAQISTDYKLITDERTLVTETFKLQKTIKVDSGHHLVVLNNFVDLKFTNQVIQLVNSNDASIIASEEITDWTISDVQIIGGLPYLVGYDKSHASYVKQINPENLEIIESRLVFDSAEITKVLGFALIAVPQVFQSNDLSKVAIVRKEIQNPGTIASFRIKVFDANLNFLNEHVIHGGAKKTAWLNIKSAVLTNEGDFFAQFKSLKSGREMFVTKEVVFDKTSHVSIYGKQADKSSAYQYDLVTADGNLYYYTLSTNPQMNRTELLKTSLDHKLNTLKTETVLSDDESLVPTIHTIEEMEDGRVLVILENIVYEERFSDVVIYLANPENNSFKKIIVEKNQFCYNRFGSFKHVLKANNLYLIYNAIDGRNKKATNNATLVIDKIDLVTEEKVSIEALKISEVGCLTERLKSFVAGESSILYYVCD